jgi:uncharacterized protein
MMNILMALLGGGLIGLSAALFLLLLGRIAGVSGVLGGLLSSSPKRWFSEQYLWRVGFVVGIMLISFVASWLPAGSARVPQLGSPWLLSLSGLLVGIGVSLANGCTSGHGVCGMARLSKRSMVAVCVFMLTAMLTVLMRSFIA